MHHRRGLRRHLGDEAGGRLAEALLDDYESSGLDARLLAMLRYADKLTRTPGAMEAADADALRTAGFTDEDVLAIAMVVSYYAFANRIADGLGLAIEAEPGT